MRRKIVILFILSISFLKSYSQDFNNIFLDISIKDKIYIITKPISSIKVIRVSREVQSTLSKIQYQNFLDSDPKDGQLDAFRHIFLLYRLSSEIGVDKARRFGNIYESYNEKVFYNIANTGYDEASELMDKYNNELGIYLYLKFEKISDNRIIKEIENTILEGNARIIMKDIEGRSLDSEGKLIMDSIWKKTWKNKRQLIRSIK